MNFIFILWHNEWADDAPAGICLSEPEAWALFQILRSTHDVSSIARCDQYSLGPAHCLHTWEYVDNGHDNFSRCQVS